MLLLVGNRYGFQTNDGKSITNLEYLRAKAKGIPIYVFVLKSILNNLTVWEKNPNADFSSIVDSPKLFEFVKSLQGSKDHWVFPFESAEDIIDTLRCQLAYLFMDALALRQRASREGLTYSGQTLKGNALRIFIEKPPYWEYLLFSQILLDEIHSLRNLRFDLQYRIGIGEHNEIDNPPEVLDWLNARTDEIKAIASSLDQLMNTALPEAVGPTGQPGDPEHIIYVARRIASSYEQAIKWAITFNRVTVPDNFKHLLTIVSAWPTNIIRDVEQFAESLYTNLRSAVDAASKGTGPRRLEMTLTLTIPDQAAFYEELNHLRNEYGL
jgi:hypothetical protein